ncbi:hypothetical protein JVT61DRAFT_3668 [Boletus reticuloceps]|uniref:Uncharacterized protein n=1 Tax=Boletus reticuloceps TaxID=495285 RepID=A0A8I2YN49_9AGAM|nr:hypothetical protein JVT61DRAFT_3668 [Boletus reticuloceps]
MQRHSVVQSLATGASSSVPCSSRNTPWSLQYTLLLQNHTDAPCTQNVVKTISRFKDVAHSAHLRHDGKLLVASNDTSLVQVFDINSRAILSTLDAHKQPVKQPIHITKFSPLLLPMSSHAPMI